MPPLHRRKGGIAAFLKVDLDRKSTAFPQIGGQSPKRNRACLCPAAMPPLHRERSGGIAAFLKVELDRKSIAFPQIGGHSPKKMRGVFAPRLAALFAVMLRFTGKALNFFRGYAAALHFNLSISTANGSSSRARRCQMRALEYLYSPRMLHQPGPDRIEMNVIHLLHKSIFPGHSKRIRMMLINGVLIPISPLLDP